MKKTKRYFVKYTIYDGEHEYADAVTHDLNPERLDDDLYVLNEIHYSVEGEGFKHYENDSTYYEREDGCDYRLYELHSIIEIPKADIEILNKYK